MFYINLAALEEECDRKVSSFYLFSWKGVRVGGGGEGGGESPKKFNVRGKVREEDTLSLYVL